jgi:hypothetical protein
LSLEENGECGGNVEVIGTSEVCNALVDICLVCQISQPPTVITGQVVTKECLLVNLIIHRDIGFSDFVHRPDFSQITMKKTQRFGNWICFRPQVREDTYSLNQ